MHLLINMKNYHFVHVKFINSPSSGIFCIITVLVPDDAVFETLIIFLISKTMISASYLIIYPFAGELYPTQVRGVGIGTSSYIGGLGLIGIPFINYLVCNAINRKALTRDSLLKSIFPFSHIRAKKVSVFLLF